MYLVVGIVWIGAVVLIGIDSAPEVHPSRWVLGGVAYLTSVTVVSYNDSVSLYK